MSPLGTKLDVSLKSTTATKTEVFQHMPCMVEGERGETSSAKGVYAEVVKQVNNVARCHNHQSDAPLDTQMIWHYMLDLNEHVLDSNQFEELSNSLQISCVRSQNLRQHPPN